MNYELAKKLKKVGFPHEWCSGFGKAGHFQEGCDKTIPTLSELIEACPKIINKDTLYEARFSLSYWEEGWVAMLDKCDYSPYNHLEGKGSTSEEAVANLWLALNTK